MADQEQLALLRQGVDVWNRWRQNKPGVRPDLRGADLSGAELPGADLRLAQLDNVVLKDSNLQHADISGSDIRAADLRSANLSMCDLKRTNFKDAVLSHANLHRAKFRGAILDSADLSNANLTGAFFDPSMLHNADLGGANLRRASFTGARLNHSNLREAELWETVFADSDLAEVEGLEQCRHTGPSTLDYRTIQRSGMLPVAFLRGCGLPETLIEYFPSLLNEAIQYSSCFISYSSQDESFAEHLHADLQRGGVRCWFAPEDMKIGDRIRTRIDEVIHIHDRLMLILSEHSVNSAWVEKEVETAFEKEDQRKESVLFPIRLDDAVLNSKTGWAADIKRTRHIGDFSRWRDGQQYRNSFDRLLRDLKVD